MTMPLRYLNLRRGEQHVPNDPEPQEYLAICCVQRSARFAVNEQASNLAPRARAQSRATPDA
jgi:hypothetical protein